MNILVALFAIDNYNMEIKLKKRRGLYIKEGKVECVSENGDGSKTIEGHAPK